MKNNKVQELFLAPTNLAELNKIYGQFLPKEQATYRPIQDKQNHKTPLSQTEQTFLQDYQKQLETQKSSYEQISANTMENPPFSDLLWDSLSIWSWRLETALNSTNPMTSSSKIRPFRSPGIS